MNRFYCLLLFLTFPILLSGQLLDVVNGAPITPENLISNVFLGDGVEVVSINFDGNADAVGLFTNGQNSIGMERGVVMTTGFAAAAPGQTGVNVNSSTNSSDNNGVFTSDDDLEDIVGNGNDIVNLARYTIEFIPVNDTLRFTYAFASEEYPEYACSDYNDVFGFFISGPGVNGPYENNAENIALIPGTNLPVTINNVNPGTPGALGDLVNCSGSNGSLAYSQFYNANSAVTRPVYDGFTDVFIAEAIVEPCSTYTIKLVIADVFDGLLDSGVFLEAKSFGTGSLDVEIEGLAIDGGMAEGCSEGEIVFNLPAPVEDDYDVEFAVGGTATEGVDYPFLPDDIIIPAGDSTFRLPIFAFEDDLVEGDETILLSVQRDPCNRDTFTIIIKDNILLKPDLGPDLQICASESVQLDATIEVPLPDPPRFVNNTPLEIATHNVQYVSEIDVLGVLPLELGPDAIKQICIDSLEHRWIDDLDIFLIGPDGQFLELSTDNGADGGNGLGIDGYYNTCFTVTAATPISAPGPFAPASAVPFTGNWLPEGDFSFLWDGDYTTNGTWQLVITDDTATGTGTLYSWSMCFNPVYQVDYRWTPTAGLSCTDCPDPIANPSETTTYVVEVFDSYGCTEQDTITIQVDPALSIDDLACGTLTSSSVEATWSAVPGFSTYEISVNGVLVTTTSNTSYTVTDLEPDTEVTISVVGFGSDCPTFPATIVCQSLSCEPATASAAVTDVNCNGGNDGSITLTIETGTGPFEFELDGVTNTTGTFTGLTAATYNILIRDSAACPGAINVTVDEPMLPNIEPITVTPLACNGDTNGALTVDITDGNGPYTFNWSNSSSDSIATDLGPGLYTLELVDQGNCSQMVQIELLEPTALALVMAADSVDCNGTTSGQAWVTATGGTGSYTYAWDNMATTDTATALVAGTYSVIVTDSLGCEETASIQVAEPGVLSAQAMASPATCFGENSGSLSALANGGSGPLTYQWINTGLGTDAGTTPTLADQPAGNYQLIVTDANGCEALDNAAITEPDELAITDLQTEVPSCVGLADGTAQVTFSGGTNPVTVSWDTGTTGDAESALAAGAHFVALLDGNGCTDTLAFELAAPLAVALSLDATAVSCFGGNDATATVTPQGGATPYIYAWNNGDDLAQASSLAEGPAIVTVTDANGCVATDTIAITQPPVLTVDLDGTDPSCFQGNNGTILASPDGGVAPYRYSWSNNDVTATAMGLLANTNYGVTILDANDCPTDASLTLGEPNLLTVAGSATQQACTGPPNGTATALPAGGTAPYTYTWPDNQTTATATGLTAGSYEVTVTDDQACTATFTAEVEPAEAVAILAANPTDVTCNGDASGAITVELTGGEAPYSWSSPLVNLTAGTYDLTVTDANMCTDVVSVTINEPSALALTTNITNVICAGEITGAVDLSVSGGTGPYTYAWNGGSTSEDLNQLGAGDYVVTVTDQQNCSTTLTSTVAQASELNVAAAVSAATCAGSPTGSILPTVTGGEAPYAFSWSNGSTATEQQAIVAGTYALTLTDDFGCNIIQTYDVTEPPLLTASAVVDPVTCFGLSDGFLKVDAVGGRPPYRYRLNSNDWQGSGVFLGLPSAVYGVAVEDANGCAATVDDQLVTQPAEVTVNLGEDQEIKFGETLPISAMVTSDFPIVSYAWSPFDSTWLSCADCEVGQVASPVRTRDLRLRVVDANGCEGEDMLRIIVLKDFPVLVPTGFTPNGDLVNNRLLVHSPVEGRVLTFRVWNRWGELVHESSDFAFNDDSEGWDGQYRGQDAPPGVYIWQVEAELPDNSVIVEHGQTTLIR
ncbi:MAG: choice-of-anchor L domain-containing protein [Bacteroidota bacterium]